MRSNGVGGVLLPLTEWLKLDWKDTNFGDMLNFGPVLPIWGLASFHYDFVTVT